MSTLSHPELYRRLQAAREQGHALILARSQIQHPLRLPRDFIRQFSHFEIGDCANKLLPLYYTVPVPSGQEMSALSSAFETAYETWWDAKLLREYDEFVAKTVVFESPSQMRALEADHAGTSRGGIDAIIEEVRASHTELCQRFRRLKANPLPAADDEYESYFDLNPLFEEVVVLQVRDYERGQPIMVYVVRVTNEEGTGVDLMQIEGADATHHSNTVLASLGATLRWAIEINAKREAVKRCARDYKAWPPYWRYKGDNPNKQMREKGYKYNGPLITPELLLQHRDPQVRPAIIYKLLQAPPKGRSRCRELDGLPWE